MTCLIIDSIQRVLIPYRYNLGHKLTSSARQWDTQTSTHTYTHTTSAHLVSFWEGTQGWASQCTLTRLVRTWVCLVGDAGLLCLPVLSVVWLTGAPQAPSAHSSACECRRQKCTQIARECFSMAPLKLQAHIPLPVSNVDKSAHKLRGKVQV